MHLKLPLDPDCPTAKPLKQSGRSRGSFGESLLALVYHILLRRGLRVRALYGQAPSKGECQDIRHSPMCIYPHEYKPEWLYGEYARNHFGSRLALLVRVATAVRNISCVAVGMQRNVCMYVCM